jgi:nucleotide-binding universal stress UspA family protein
VKPSRMKTEQILCPTDYSDFSERALAQALRLARWFDASVTVVHVVAPTPWLGSPDSGVITIPADLLRVQRQEEAETLERFVAPYRDEGVAIYTRLVDGDPSRAIQAAVLELSADLMVIGTHGRGGFEHLLLGSVTEKVLRRATCPVLTVGRAGAAAPAGPLFRRILCALDLTEGSERTLEVALSLAEETMSRVTLLHVLEGVPGWAGPPRYRALPQVVRVRRELFEAAENRLRSSVSEEDRAFCSVTERVEEGVPWREVLRVADACDAEVIVMGAHSRGALDQALFGSTANHVVREARCPVLVVREMTANETVKEEVLATSASSPSLRGGTAH